MVWMRFQVKPKEPKESDIVKLWNRTSTLSWKTCFSFSHPVRKILENSLFSENSQGFFYTENCKPKRYSLVFLPTTVSMRPTSNLWEFSKRWRISLNWWKFPNSPECENYPIMPTGWTHVGKNSQTLETRVFSPSFSGPRDETVKRQTLQGSEIRQ